ncbi:sodium/potassium-transporting ATPase subunit beta-like isoform X2 [Babylonia areolata]
MLSFFYQTVSVYEPYLTGDHSFLETPGLGIRPLLKTDDDLLYMSLIYFTDDASEKHTKACIKSLKEALRPYKKAHEENYARFWKSCGEASEKPDKVQSCIVSYRLLATSDCSEDNDFGYPDGKPCVLVTLNKVYDWTPDPYKGLASRMSKKLKNAVTMYYQQNKDPVPLLWIHCEGEDEYDEDNLGNNTAYYPHPGIPANYFPFLNQFRHLAPAVFVKFNSLKPNVAVKVHCKGYAHNVKFDKDTWEGGFHLELFYRK